jgi:hypothetical protein
MFFKTELQKIFSLDSRMLSISNCSLLYASDDCAEQRLHSDFDYRLPCARDSFVCFVGIEEVSHIVVFDETIKLSRLVVYGPGDLLIFRGDCIHAGGHYEVEHLRPHFYAEKILGNGHRLGRKLDAVYFFDQHEIENQNPVKKKQYGLILRRERFSTDGQEMRERCVKAREGRKRKREGLSL